jgi:hypothetical protein
MTIKERWDEIVIQQKSSNFQESNRGDVLRDGIWLCTGLIIGSGDIILAGEKHLSMVGRQSHHGGGLHGSRSYHCRQEVVTDGISS